MVPLPHVDKWVWQYSSNYSTYVQDKVICVAFTMFLVIFMHSRGHCILVHVISIALLCSVSTFCLGMADLCRSSVLGIGAVTFVPVGDHGE